MTDNNEINDSDTDAIDTSDAANPWRSLLSPSAIAATIAERHAPKGKGKVHNVGDKMTTRQQRMDHRQPEKPVEPVNQLSTLNPLQRQVFNQLIVGNPNYVQIATALGLLPSMISACLTDIKTQLGVDSTAALFKLAITKGLIPLPTGLDLQELIIAYGTTLSSNEKIILHGLAEGDTQEKLATKMHQSISTVCKSRDEIMQNLKLDHLRDLVVASVAIHNTLGKDLYQPLKFLALSTIPLDPVKNLPKLLAGFEQLTPSEHEVFLQLANGHTAQEIATIRSIGITTIRTQIQEVQIKLDTHTQSGLVRAWVAIKEAADKTSKEISKFADTSTPNGYAAKFKLPQSQAPDERSGGFRENIPAKTDRAIGG